MSAANRAVVAIGGGHGLAAGLDALRRLDVSPTAIVTTADDGGSTGRLRRDLGVIAPGDLRMALLALAEPGPLAAVTAHRFDRGELAGHALGNLLLVALAEQHGGDFVAALDTLAELLGCQGRVLPATDTPVDLVATAGGEQLRGQARITRSDARIDAVHLEPSDAPACPETLRALTGADAIVLGPGSLYTSVVAGLLVPEIARAVAGASAPVIYVANLRTQRGETAGLDLAAHVRVVAQAIHPRPLDTVLAHDGPIRREEDGDPDPAPVAGPVPDGLARTVQRVDLAAREADGSVGAGHDPDRLAQGLAAALALPVPPIVRV
ncbi:YvcK family protein [Egibacter rhizosphaerae]|uniref:Putative gluconeogenesis factor n=1 Tax=Egibacter rhizosphaerae TaxID=1670831 RepID=A0A411YKN9_9ACTN|nr:gluconeogenesis factor YvcK family protein [Egibacter rhizosphaerae]QBI21762.1 YvcK family protein [Egibacter rhizosphaerae]